MDSFAAMVRVLLSNRGHLLKKKRRTRIGIITRTFTKKTTVKVCPCVRLYVRLVVSEETDTIQ